MTYVSLPKPALIRPAILSSYRNGLLPPELLEPTTFGNATAIRPAARAFRAFAALEARPAGIDPRHVGGYRDLRGQLSLFLARYEPCSLAVYLLTPSSRRKSWTTSARAQVAADLGVSYIPDATYWHKRRNADGSYPATAAVPGTSNHGLGLAIDVAEELDGDPAPESISTRFRDLLIARGHLYGLGAELDSEPWHWRYYAGDNIPPAVLAFEAGQHTEPDYPRPTIRLGSVGPEVVKFQQQHNAWTAAGACTGPLVVDGNAGPRTVEAVRAWQRVLAVPVDGVYGPITAAKYRAVLLDLEAAKR